MDDRDDMYDAVDDEYDDAKRAEQLSHRMKRVAYPPRLMVDFTSLGMEALKRYAQFYNVAVRDELEKDEVAALVARHFDGTLEVEEDDSIVSFIQRLRNGERNASKRPLGDKDRKLADKKRKKSNSRKRQRDASAAHSVASSSSNGSTTSASSAGARDGTGSADDRKASASAASAASASGSGSGTSSNASSASSSAASSASSASGGASSGASAPKSHKKSADAASKKKDKAAAGGGGEDNELYCICNLPSYGNMIACDGKKCPNPSQWYHLECVGFSDGRHPDTWLCPECDPKGFAAFQSKKKKSGSHKQRSKSPASAK